MRNKMPKGKTPSLIGFSNGKPERVDVKKKSSCTRCHKPIPAGAECFNIPQKAAGFTVPKRYCKDCFGSVIDQTSKDLEALRNI